LKNLVSFYLTAFSLFFLTLPGVALSVTQADIRVAYLSLAKIKTTARPGHIGKNPAQ
jgi:hypothetical protein